MKNFYYEVILQMRGNFTDETLKLMEQVLSNFGGKNLYRYEEVKGGTDFYISKKSVAIKVAQILKRQFKAKLIRSYKLHTSIEGKNIYKMTISIRI